MVAVWRRIEHPSIHATYHVTLPHAEVFVKLAPEHHVRAEMTATHLYHILGLKAHTLPVARSQRGLHTPWVDAPLLARAPNGLSHIRLMDSSTLWRLLLVPWLLGDYDRHAENFMVTPHRILAFDHNFAFSNTVAWDAPNTKRDLIAYAGLKPYSNVPHALVRALRHHSTHPAIAHTLARVRHADAMQRRVQVLDRLTTLCRTPQLDDLVALSAEMAA